MNSTSSLVNERHKVKLKKRRRCENDASRATLWQLHSFTHKTERVVLTLLLTRQCFCNLSYVNWNRMIIYRPMKFTPKITHTSFCANMPMEKTHRKMKRSLFLSSELIHVLLTECDKHQIATSASGRRGPTHLTTRL